MNGLRQRWWKAAAMALVGGTIAAGWFGFAHAQPLPGSQPKGVPSAKVADPVVPWVRSSTAPRIELPGEKTPLPAATSKFPAIPAPPATTTTPTVIPASAKIPVPAVSTPTMPVIIQPPAPPMIPAIPDSKPIPVPPVPTTIDPVPAPAPVIPMVPKVDEPLKPVIAPPVNVAPPTPPLNSADPVKPMLPVPADFNLRPMNGANTVKPDVPATPTIPVPVPVPAVPTMPDPTFPAIPTGTVNAPPVPAIPGSRTKPEDVPFAPTEKYVFPAPVTILTPPAPTIPTPGIGTPTNIQPPTPGVPTMLNNPTVMAALTGVALAFGPSTQADDPKPADAVQMKKDLDEANRKLLIAQRDIETLTSLLYGRKGPDGKPLEYDLGALEEIRRLKDKVKVLEGQVGDMKTNSTSLRPNLPAAIGKGTVRVVNEYPIPVSIIINDKNYRVEPSTTLNVDVPVGDFSYQLLQSGAATTKSTIKEKEVVTLRVK